MPTPATNNGKVSLALTRTLNRTLNRTLTTFTNGQATPPIARGAPSPLLASSGVPLFTAWSEEWAARGWYKQRTANP